MTRPNEKSSKNIRGRRVSILLGCIADDFTGATDLENMLVQNGMPTIQLIGTPGNEMDIGRAKALVIALKSGIFRDIDFFNKAFKVLG